MRRSVVLGLDLSPESAARLGARCLRRLVPAAALVIALCQTIRLLKQQAGTEFGSPQRLDHHGAGAPWPNSAVDRDDVLARQPAAHCQINGGSL